MYFQVKPLPMMREVSRLLLCHRRSLTVLTGTVALGVLLVQTFPFASMAWGGLTGGPDIGLAQDVRHALLAQPPFQKMLEEHEEVAIRRHGRGGASSFQRRRLVRINLTPFGLPGFHDVFAVRVRTDIIEGEAYTSFLARPGVVIDPNAAAFFSGQCESSVCKRFIRALVGAGHQLLEWGVLTPFRLNVTEMDATSSVSIGADPVSTTEWARHSRQLHQKGTGRSF
jgi:hypothetical protein